MTIIISVFLFVKNKERKINQPAEQVQNIKVETTAPETIKETPVNSKINPVYRYKFEDYPVEKGMTGLSAPLNLRSNLKGLEYRTVISEAYKDGPNFAGHYTVVGWGNGIPEADYVIVDNLTGNISNFFIAMNGAVFRLDSRLLVVDPDNIVDNCTEVDNFICFNTKYFEMSNNESELIKLK